MERSDRRLSEGATIAALAGGTEEKGVNAHDSLSGHNSNREPNRCKSGLSQLSQPGYYVLSSSTTWTLSYLTTTVQLDKFFACNDKMVMFNELEMIRKAAVMTCFDEKSGGTEENKEIFR